MAKKSSFLLKVIIFCITTYVGYTLFAQDGGGVASAFFLMGELIIGSNLSQDATSTTSTILSFIITVAIYYFITLIIAYVLTALFGKKN